MILTFIEKDGKTGARLTLGEAVIADGHYLRRDGRHIVGDSGIRGTVTHNNTIGKQGGQAGQYYHLTAAEYGGNWGAKNLITTGWLKANALITTQDIGIQAHKDLIQLTGVNVMQINGRLGIGVAANAANMLEVAGSVRIGDPGAAATLLDVIKDNDGPTRVNLTNVNNHTNAYAQFVANSNVVSLTMGVYPTLFAASEIRDKAVVYSTKKLALFGVADEIQFYTDGIDAGNKRMILNAGGDLIFLGDSTGLLYGSCYGNHIGWVQANAAQNTWYNIVDDDMTTGELNNVTHDGNGKLTVLVAGRYKIDYGICFENDVANDHVECGIEITGSGSATAAGQSHLENKFANEEEHMGNCAILDLATNATIEITIRTIDANTPDFTVHALNIAITMIGGT